MATMCDSVSGDACPQASIIGGYVDGSYGPDDPYGSGWSAAAWARYPHSYHVTITVEGSPGARAADCEEGALWPPYKAANWARAEVNAGRRPTVYGSAWDWANGIDQALSKVGLERVRDVDGWVADVDGGDQSIPTGFVARQWAQNQPGLNGGRVDWSVTNGVWPGSGPAPTPVPTPSPTPVSEDIVPVSNVFPWEATFHALQITGGHIYNKYAIGTPQANSEDIGFKAGYGPVVFPDQTPQYAINSPQLQVTAQDSSGGFWYFVQEENVPGWHGQEVPV